MFLEDPNKRICLACIAAHPWVTNKDVPSDEDLRNEIDRLNRVRQGEINQWVMIEPSSYVFIGDG
jgi:hypothetical protein